MSALLATTSGSDTWMLVAGAVALFVALAIGLGMALAPRVRRRRLAEELDGPQESVRSLSALGTKATELAERGLAKHDREHVVASALERAGIDLSAAEFVLLAGVATLAGALLGGVLAGILGALIIGGCTAAGFGATVSVKSSRRRSQFSEQLPDALSLLSGGLRAGHSLTQAMDALVQETDGPIHEEFKRVLFEVQLGHSMGTALAAVAHRVRSEDFDWVAQAIDIQREIGGDLAAVLDNVAATIRDRARVQRQIQTLTAEGRFSGLVLFMLPIAVLLLLLVANPGYMDSLTSSVLGIVVLSTGGGLMLVGGIWLRRIVRLEF